MTYLINNYLSYQMFYLNIIGKCMPNRRRLKHFWKNFIWFFLFYQLLFKCSTKFTNNIMIFVGCKIFYHKYQIHGLLRSVNFTEKF